VWPWLVPSQALHALMRVPTTFLADSSSFLRRWSPQYFPSVASTPKAIGFDYHQENGYSWIAGQFQPGYKIIVVVEGSCAWLRRYSSGPWRRWLRHIRACAALRSWSP
jgi:hypothetical protein